MSLRNFPRYFKVLAVLALAFLATSLMDSALAAESGVRVISLYAAHTENLLRIGAKDNLVGISAQETYNGPETVGWNRPQVFSARDDAEKYLAAKPDLILLRPMHLASSPKLWAALEKTGTRIWAKQVLSAKDIYDYWRELGDLVGRKEEAAKMVAEFQAAVAPYENRPEGVKRPGVFLEAIHKELKTFTPDSIPAWLLELAGGRNVASGVASGQGLIVEDFGPERLLAIASEVEIYISQEGPMNRTSLEEIKGRSILRELSAFKTGRVYKVPEALISRPTPEILRGLSLLVDIVDPSRKK